MTSMDSALSPQESGDNSISNGCSTKKKALLVRSNALCGDDDTKSLRHPLQQMVVSTAYSMPTMGAGSNSTRMRTKHYSNTSSRDSSTITGGRDYVDSSGVHYLLQFIDSTLHKNAKDREMLLNLELEMRKFVLDTSRQAYKFPKMSSYNRMLVHRVAAFFGLDHNIDQTGTVVVVNKTPSTGLPEVEFRSLIKNNLYTDRMLHNRRNVQSFDECRLSSLYGNYQPSALVNLQQQHPFPVTPTYGSANLDSTVAGPNYPALSSSMDIIRRARSFEVGEWQNSMAVMSGGGVAPGILPLSTPRHHRLSGGSTNSVGTNSAGSSVNWQQQQPFRPPGLEGMGFVAGPLPYAAPPPQLLQQSSFSPSRPESLASLHSRLSRFGSGECVLDQQQQATSYGQVRSRQVSNSSSQRVTSSPITSQLANLPSFSPNHIKQRQDSGFEGVAAPPEDSGDHLLIDPSGGGQILQHNFPPPPPTYPWPEGAMQYMAGTSPANTYGYAVPPNAAYPPMMYVPTSRGFVQVIGSPQYYVASGAMGMPMGGVGTPMPVAAAAVPYQQPLAAGYGSSEQCCMQQLSEQYQETMNMSSPSEGTQRCNGPQPCSSSQFHYHYPGVASLAANGVNHLGAAAEQTDSVATPSTAFEKFPSVGQTTGCCIAPPTSNNNSNNNNN